MELRRKNSRESSCRKKNRVGESVGMLKRKRDQVLSPSSPELLSGGLRRISIEYSSGFQVCLLKVAVSTDW